VYEIKMLFLKTSTGSTQRNILQMVFGKTTEE
jgi:hypothetical protein